MILSWVLIITHIAIPHRYYAIYSIGKEHLLFLTVFEMEKGTYYKLQSARYDVILHHKKITTMGYIETGIETSCMLDSFRMVNQCQRLVVTSSYISQSASTRHNPRWFRKALKMRSPICHFIITFMKQEIVMTQRDAHNHTWENPLYP